jgi:hypothetical protein
VPPEQRNTNGELQVDADGTIHVPAYALPPSPALNDHSRASMAAALSRTPRMTIPRAEDFSTEADFKAMVDGFRANVDIAFARPMSERLLGAFPVDIAPGQVGGVPVEEFTPLDGLDAARVLMNLHGGAFYSGATYVSRIESIPMANLALRPALFPDPQRTLPGRQRLQENTQPRRQEFPTRVDSENRDVGGSPLRQQAHEPTVGECFITVCRGQ